MTRRRLTLLSAGRKWQGLLVGNPLLLQVIVSWQLGTLAFVSLAIYILVRLRLTGRPRLLIMMLIVAVLGCSIWTAMLLVLVRGFRIVRGRSRALLIRVVRALAGIGTTR